MDILTTTSPDGAYPIVQGAVHEVMSRHRLYRHKTDLIGLNQPVGPITRARMNWLVREGFGAELKNALVEHRLAAARRLPHYKHNPGWIRRFRRFLEPMRGL